MGRYYSGDIEGKFWFGVQSSDDASFFGGNEDEVVEEGFDDPSELAYSFSAEDLPTINEGIDSCLTNLEDNKTKLDSFFEGRMTYSDKDLVTALGVNAVKVRELLEWYARLELGNKIKACVEENGECHFTAEL